MIRRFAAAGFEGASARQRGCRVGCWSASARTARPRPTTVRCGKAAGAAARAASHCERIATTLPATQSVAEGFALGAYRFTKYRSDPKPNRIESQSRSSDGAASERGQRSSAARASLRRSRVARDLVQRAGGSLTAPRSPTSSARLAKRSGLTVKVLTENAIEKAGYSGLLARQPRLDQSAAVGRADVRTRDAGAHDRRARRQGHHVRLGRPVASRPPTAWSA